MWWKKQKEFTWNWIFRLDSITGKSFNKQQSTKKRATDFDSEFEDSVFVKGLKLSEVEKLLKSIEPDLQMSAVDKLLESIESKLRKSAKKLPNVIIQTNNTPNIVSI